MTDNKEKQIMKRNSSSSSSALAMIGEVRLWIRPEVMEIGLLPVLPPDKISLDMLSRLLRHAKNRGGSGYPSMTYDTWKDIAVKKMGLSVECGMVVFYTCLLFSQRFPNGHSKLEAGLVNARSQKERDELMSEAQVSTLELVLLLYLHRSNTYPRVVARQASLQSLTNDPWPDGNPGPRKQLQEERNLQFIKEYLPEMLNLLAGQSIPVEEGESEKKSVRELLGFMRYAGVFSVQVVAALSFLIGVTLPKDKSEKDLLSVAKDKHNGYRSGFLSKKNAFQRGLFEGWVLNALDWCPDGEGTCIRRGRRQSWPLIYCSAQSSHRLVASSSTGKRLVYLCDLIDGLTAHIADDIAHNSMKIRRCHKSNIYVLQPLRHVVVHKCHETRVVLGPVGGRVKISECRNSVVVCAARSLVITECRNMVIYTLTPQRPLILGARSQGITLAPLNMHYPHLHKHMASLGLQPSINMWNRPLFLGCEGTATQSTCCQLMAAEDFFLLTVPFVKPPQDNRPPLLPPGLPQEFVKSVEEAGRIVLSFQSEVKDANLSGEQRVKLQKSVDANFKKWLKESGHQRELDQLEKLNALLRYERAAKTTAI